MQENIRKLVAAAGCPILAGSLFLRLGWETTKASPVLVFALAPSETPHQNVTKSVAKARKNTQVTTSQLQPHQQHRRDFPQKHPLPPPFRPKPGLRRNKFEALSVATRPPKPRPAKFTKVAEFRSKSLQPPEYSTSACNPSPCGPR